MRSLRAFFDRLQPFAPFTVRLMVGVLFLRYGIPKLRAMPDFAKQVEEWKLPHWVALAAPWGSVVGGGAVLLGVFTRLAALALIALEGLVIVKTRLHGPFENGLDLPLLMLAACVSLSLSGAGKPSVDARVMSRWGGE